MCMRSAEKHASFPPSQLNIPEKAASVCCFPSFHLVLFPSHTPPPPAFLVQRSGGKSTMGWMMQAEGGNSKMEKAHASARPTCRRKTEGAEANIVVKNIGKSNYRCMRFPCGSSDQCRGTLSEGSENLQQSMHALLREKIGGRKLHIRPASQHSSRTRQPTRV